MARSSGNGPGGPIADSPEHRGVTRWNTRTAGLLLALGLAVSIYLLVRHFSMKNGVAEGMDLCLQVLGSGCDDALRSPWAERLGMPLAGWGVVYFGTLAFLKILGSAVGGEFRRDVGGAALFLAVGGSFVSLALLGYLLVGPIGFCPACAVVHVVNLLMTVLLLRGIHCPLMELVQRSAHGFRRVLLDRRPLGETIRWKLVGFFCAGLVAVTLWQWILIEQASIQSTANRFNPDTALDTILSVKPQSMPVRPEDAQFGRPDAPHQLVVFSDFECVACGRFHEVVNALRRQFGQAIHVVHKDYPLNSDCNERVTDRRHPKACEAAAAAEAARLQDRFWPYHDAIFHAIQSGEEFSFEGIAQEIGLDLDKFRSDRVGPAARQAVQQDVADGHSLLIQGTPAVFLDGRRVYDLSYENLEFLIKLRQSR